ETTLGAIDNGYRHALSLFSKMVFVSTDEYKARAEEIVENSVEVFNVGALSVDNLRKVNFLSKEQFKHKFNIDLEIPTLLSTFHPETVALSKNKDYIQELVEAFKVLENDFQILITLPNTDTMGQMIRDHLLEYGKNNPKVKIVESLGMLGYLSAIKHCEMLVGNTSSGFVEATYFPKYVVNLGNRQSGRIITENIKTIDIFKSEIVNTVKTLQSKPNLQDLNVYGKGNTASLIIDVLKKI
ncbi:MAG: UDP-N-acetylglucosamine 2-epimerase, partial [Flavobacteriales bacterium]